MNNSRKILNKLGLTNKQIDLLLLVLPYPLGKGLIMKEAQEALKISKTAFFSRLRNVKKNKKVWKALTKFIKLVKEDEDKIDNASRSDCINKLDKIYKKF